MAPALLFYIDGYMGHCLRRDYLLDETLSTIVFLLGALIKSPISSGELLAAGAYKEDGS
jgi:hypothetical protein